MAGEAHTPGPWVYGAGSESSVHAKEGGLVASVFPCAPPDCDLFQPWPLEAEMKANARLIAAAPDLLEACKRALTLLEPFDDPELSLGLGSDALTPLRSAIARTQAGEGA